MQDFVNGLPRTPVLRTTVNRAPTNGPSEAAVQGGRGRIQSSKFRMRLGCTTHYGGTRCRNRPVPTSPASTRLCPRRGHLIQHFATRTSGCHAVPAEHDHTDAVFAQVVVGVEQDRI